MQIGALLAVTLVNFCKSMAEEIENGLELDEADVVDVYVVDEGLVVVDVQVVVIGEWLDAGGDVEMGVIGWDLDEGGLEAAI